MGDKRYLICILSRAAAIVGTFPFRTCVMGERHRHARANEYGEGAERRVLSQASAAAGMASATSLLPVAIEV